jgi:hypothetical protein
MIGGSLTRLVLFVLVPTTYAYQNTLLYIPNDIFTASFDGLPTFIAAIVSLVSFVVVAYLTKGDYPTRSLSKDESTTIVAGGDED